MTRSRATTAAGTRAWPWLGVLAAVTAGCASQSPDRAEVVYRGTPAATQSLGTAGVSGQDVVNYDGYQAVRARSGDTVGSVAGRLGISPVELAAYNGLSPTSDLREGDELVVPPQSGGGAVAVAPEPQSAPIPAPTGDTTIEAQSLDGTGLATATTGDGLPVDQETPTWSPDLAAAAIDRATGIDESGNLNAPPSANDPLPDDPQRAPELNSPDLGQYQTAGGEAVAPLPEPAASAPAVLPDPVSSGTAAAPAGEDTQVAARTVATDPAPAPAATPGTGLQRPVSGPVALGYGQGGGGTRNDGVDFAAPAGSPVVAAADGEVALVSQALGGLGTIVLLRHEGELLTVYGRIDGVTVTKGDIVRRGQQIGVVARPTPPNEARMHFEVRQGANSVDPMVYLSG